MADIASWPERLSVLLKMICSENKKWFTLKTDLEYKFQSDIIALALPDAYNELLKKIITRGMETGEFSEVPIDITLRFINGLITESMKILRASPKINVEDDLIQAVFKLIH